MELQVLQPLSMIPGQSSCALVLCFCIVYMCIVWCTIVYVPSAKEEQPRPINGVFMPALLKC